MAAARTLWQQAGQAGQLHLEAFGPVRAEGGATTRHAVHIRRAPHTHRFEAPGHTTLLEASEQALARAFQRMRERIADGLTGGGQAPDRAAGIAALIVATYEGGLLQARVAQNPQPIQQATQTLLDLLAGLSTQEKTP